MARAQSQDYSMSDDQWIRDLFYQVALFGTNSDAPTLPSQLLNSYGTIAPPPGSRSEITSVAQELSSATRLDLEDAHLYHSRLPPAKVPSFAEAANAMINDQLGRVSEGNSVVEPDSVLGESGRLYHGYKDGTYFLPNDAAEQDRLDLQHEVFRLLFDGWLALAPLKAVPRNVIDIATGTGVWAQEFAEQNPTSRVIGTDLSAIQPLPRTPNCIFIKADAEDSWVFPNPEPYGGTNHSPRDITNEIHENFLKFDYVHLRLVLSCFNDTRTANPKYKNDASVRYGEGCIRGAAAFGRDVEKAPKYKRWLEEVGFVDVEEQKFVFPVNTWPQDPRLKKVGLYNLKNCYDGVRGIGWKMLRAAGYSPEEVETLILEVQAELRDPENHGYAVVYVVYGRKPTTVA
ncbi:S-adenosyl-L-methionine-dependent methyltransferase [Xylariales sp. PMI_506]|nr:S-adenosyl-L-methionine-dependent methyltransferase [Xylariales sp. PMI_506]